MEKEDAFEQKPATTANYKLHFLFQLGAVPYTVDCLSRICTDYTSSNIRIDRLLQDVKSLPPREYAGGLRALPCVASSTDYVALTSPSRATSASNSHQNTSSFLQSIFRTDVCARCEAVRIEGAVSACVLIGF
jgi:hypothetical protein